MNIVDGKEAVCRIEDFRVHYMTFDGPVKAVDGVNMEVYREETLGLVGESGCGKSTLGSALLKILPRTARMSGKVYLEGEDLMSKMEKEMQKLRGAKIAMIFQDPMTSLNPIMKVKDHFTEMIRTHKPEVSEEQALEMAARALEEVGISESRLNDYPFQFSGGMRQRMMIALSIVLRPALVIADEPTTSLDVIVQAQILQLMKEIQSHIRSSMILITHDLGVVAEMAHRIGVMYAGHLVELAPRDVIYYRPLHPYTVALLESVPNTDINDMDLDYIEGYPPSLLNIGEGCRFADRCPKVMKLCRDRTPPDVQIDEEHIVKCWLYADSFEEDEDNASG